MIYILMTESEFKSCQRFTSEEALLEAVSKEPRENYLAIVGEVRPVALRMSLGETLDEDKKRKPRAANGTRKNPTPATPQAKPEPECRGKGIRPDFQHGAPGRGRAMGFCTQCSKEVPLETRRAIAQEAKEKAKEKNGRKPPVRVVSDESQMPPTAA